MVLCVSVGGQRSICLIAKSGKVSCVSLIRIKSKEGGREILQFWYLRETHKQAPKSPGRIHGSNTPFGRPKVYR